MEENNKRKKVRKEEDWEIEKRRGCVRLFSLLNRKPMRLLNK